MEFFLGYMVKTAKGVFERPKVAAGLYALALAGVVATMDRPAGGGGITRRRGSPGNGMPATPDLPPEASILREFESSGLQVSERRFFPGEIIFSPGDPDEHLYFLRSGTVRVYKTYGEFKEATISLLKDGGVFGNPELTEGSCQNNFAEASTEARVAVVRKRSVAWLLKRRPDLALSLFSELSKRLQQSDTLIVTLLRREVSGRLAVLLSNLSDQFGTRIGEEIRLDLRLTHMELASMIASTREAVSKAMTELQRERLIDVRRRQIFVLDLEGLAERADFQESRKYSEANS